MERRLAAILVADIVGYSRLIDAQERETFEALRVHQTTVFAPLVSKYHGRIVKFMGDGALAEFSSTVNAVDCAVALQSVTAEANTEIPAERRLVLRIGVNLGDVIVEGTDLYGEGVNIGARLQALAEPGGIVVSHAVFSSVKGKVAVGFEDHGERRLKNISEPVRIYRIVDAASNATIAAARPGAIDKIAVAVLPFKNLSNDPDQVYFSEGITEDVVIDLSKISHIDVLSRHAAASYNPALQSLSQFAKQWNISYAIDGSVRKIDRRVRISVKLMDVATDTHIWAERYDRDLNDIFSVQNEISSAVVAALKIKLLPQERKALEQRSTSDADAYDLYLLGRYYRNRRSSRDIEIALRFARRALDVDTEYARAWTLTALCLSDLHLRGRSVDTGFAAAQQALSLDGSLPEAHAAMGRVLAEAGDLVAAQTFHLESLRLDASSFDVQFNYGLTCLESSDHKGAIEHLERAAELLESDLVALSMVAVSYDALGDRTGFASSAQRTLDRVQREISGRPDNSSAIIHGVLALARLGENARAHSWALRALTIEPDDLMDKYNIACAMAYMRDYDQALNLLEQCVPKMPPEFLLWIRQDQDLKDLRDLPRFRKIVAEGALRLKSEQDGHASPPS